MPAPSPLLPAGTGARRSLCTPIPPCRGPRGTGWELCRLCSLLPTPGATEASLTQYSVVQGMGGPCQQGIVGMAGGAAAACLPPSSSSGSCQPAVPTMTQPPPRRGGCLWAGEQPPQDWEPLQDCSQALSQLPCRPDLTLCLSFLQDQSGGPILPLEHQGFDSSHNYKGWQPAGARAPRGYYSLLGALGDRRGLCCMYSPRWDRKL